MKRLMKLTVQLMLISTLLILSVASGFAAEVRREPSKASVEQGFLALTLDAEGAEDFRYTGQENKIHMYRGTIQPGSKLKFTMRVTLAEMKSLPVTGRSCIMRLKVVAKKGDEVLKTQNFSKENKAGAYVNYTVPEGADTLEVTEIFVLNNKSKEEKYNQKVTSLNKLILTTSDAAGAGTADKKTDEKDGDKKTDTDKDKNTDKTDKAKNAGGDKNTTGNDKNGGVNGTTETAGDAKESKGISTKMLIGAVVALAAIGGGGFFYMKKSKEGRVRAEEIARKEKLRQQAIQRQQELQQQNLQRSQEEREQRSRMLEEKRMRAEEEARQQVQREEQQQLMQEQARQQQMQQPDVGQQQPGATGTFVAGAAGVMGSMQNNAAENAQSNVSNTAPQFCINCGAPLKPGTKFCENCGAKV